MQSIMENVTDEILEAYRKIFRGKLLPEFDNDKSRVAIATDCRDAMDNIYNRELRKIFGEPAEQVTD